MAAPNPVCGIDVACGETLIERLTFIFDPAWYDYNLKMFDNTAATFATDYALGVFMLMGAFSVYRSSPNCAFRNRTIALLLLYAASVFAGGVAHEFFTTLTDLKSTSFRVVWTICVGTVSLAVALLGALGCHMAKKYTLEQKLKRHTKSKGVLMGTMQALSLSMTLASIFAIGTSWNRTEVCVKIILTGVAGSVLGGIICTILPQLPVYVIHYTHEAVWWALGVSLTVYTAMGGLSMHRPAADIFVAGFGQSLPTLYVTSVWISNWNLDGALTTLKDKVMLIVSVYLNAPLIVIYPLVLSYLPQLSFGTVNATLHAWLTLAWGLQWWYFQRVCTIYFPLSQNKKAN